MPALPSAHTCIPGECAPAFPADYCASCPRTWAPLCNNATGQTFGNPCLARCSGLPANATVVPGVCPLPRGACVCTREYNPVCDARNVTHGNICTALCANATIVAVGECPASPAPGGGDGGCICTEEWAPGEPASDMLNLTCSTQPHYHTAGL